MRRERAGLVPALMERYGLKPWELDRLTDHEWALIEADLNTARG